MLIKIKDVARQKAVELGIHPDAAAFACLGIGKCIQEKLATVDLYNTEEDYTEEELKKLNLTFHIYKFGKIAVKYPHYKKVRKILKDAKSRKNNTRV